MIISISLSVKDDANLNKEICAVANHLIERSGRIEGHDHDNWIEAGRIVRTLRKIAGDDGKRCILVNVPDDYRKFYRHLLQEGLAP